ncbi:major capsid family protein, partial [Acinetobacter baumannii]|uniref:major capsid family protein n=1 Tax=Acinetobacter baumannii TaxID=470 RepID=UPI003AF954C5
GTELMMFYTQNENRVRFQMVPLQRTPVEYRDLRKLTTYYGRLGAVVWVYPETAFYSDGI